MKETIVKLKFCTLSFFDNYVISVINEGEHVDYTLNKILIKKIEKHFNKPFVYITNRINSYSVDPNIYPRTTEVKNLAGFAVVSKAHMAKVNAQIEQMFFGKPFEIFSELEEAIAWAKKILKQS
ncbi:hypothetical protein [Winogradskyella aquimaris]|uniref:SpoIIAA-like n=1 Tax=Winogradskyella aquimaris TaxID=864074 RepID=A0ABU5ETS7_9FLAO|nr:hypothetical protein [Winogradskyella aquimaris]MDY2588316.1 hypothetical protein [Winogradskyella aquimaris]